MFSKEFERAFSAIDNGLSYKEAAREYKIGESVLRTRHIEFSKEDPDYEKKIQRLAIKLIQDVGVHTIRAIRYPNYADMAEFFNTRAIDLVPYKYRDTVKALACGYVKELDRKDREKIRREREEFLQ